MKVITETKFNVGDIVYIVDHYYDWYAYRKPYIITDIQINISSRTTRILYEIEQDGLKSHTPEGLTFATYEECARWCEENN